MARFKTCLMLLLLLLVPVQGMASALGPLMCSPAMGGHHAVPADAHEGHGASTGHSHEAAPASHTHASDEDQGHNHSLCHQVFSGVPMSAAAAPVADFPVFAPTVYLLPPLFVPEQPRRPPKA